MVKNAEQLSGSALVVGGGIAGMQSSIDLVNLGFKVYLVEEKTAIGGTMSMLDKTFPTNDCAMCMISPKLVECGRNKDIEILTNSLVQDMEKTEKGYRVKLFRKARYVDEKVCTGCGECEKVCPVDVFDDFNQRISTRKAINRLYPQAVPNVFAITKNKISPCRDACPAGVNSQAYVALISKGKFREAVDVVRKSMPFPSSCGRICHHPCERECYRAKHDEPVKIKLLKRFVGDWDLFSTAEKIEEPAVEPKNKKVAIIGGGPAGLSCAYYLKNYGYEATVFDANEEAGGMLRYGIPEYRLPKDMLKKEITLLEKRGIKIKTGVRVDKPSFEKMRKEYDAIFVGAGLAKDKKLPIKGNDLSNVLTSIEFLKKSLAGEVKELKGRVVVIGGGNVATDVARVARRIGAEDVAMVCLESREKMPAHKWEIEEAIEEGVKMFPGRTMLEITEKDGKANGVRCQEVNFYGFDETGRPKMDILPNTERVISGDIIIFAVGLRSELDFLTEDIETTKQGYIKTNKTTMQTSAKGVFCGGDVMSGPASFADATGDGRRAAEAINYYLEGNLTEEIMCGEKPEVCDFATVRQPWDSADPVKIRMSSSDDRVRDFREVELGFTEEEAMREAKRCLSCGICSECMECVKACKPNAIRHDDKPKIVELDVGAVVLTAGIEKFNAEIKSEYGYGRYANVYDSLQFERILSASGPYMGHVVRRSDEKPPKKIAFIQCVGSRDVSEKCNSYCSSVCCMAAIKQSIVVKDHVKDCEVTVFYIDIRAMGKDFEKYYNRAKEKYGVKFVKSLVSAVRENPKTKNLLLKYYDESENCVEEEFSMVVLSVGVNTRKATREQLGRLGVSFDKDNFCLNERFPAWSQVAGMEGVFTAGMFQSPKDIPETVMQASAVSSAVSERLKDARFSEIVKKVYPPEITEGLDNPRIGVFICHCGINIGSVVDVKKVAEEIRKMPNVVIAEDNLYTCSQDTQEKIKKYVKDLNLNRVIVSSCTPRTHEPLFHETMREAGLNRYLFEMADIREQCSWVHKDIPQTATEKAAVLTKMAVAKARRLVALKNELSPVTKRGLVVGGGFSGMVCAESIANQGYEVVLAEKTDSLGGNMRKLQYTPFYDDVKQILNEQIRRVSTNPLIKVMFNTTVSSMLGHAGEFKVELKSGEVVSHIEVGAIVVATGAKEYVPEEYSYGTLEKVLTQRQLQEKIIANDADLVGVKNVVMIQCIGSRNEKNPNCSRICCGEAIRNAVELKKRNGSVNVTVLYRDVRTYGLMEDLYREARQLGVNFARFTPENQPAADKENPTKIRYPDAGIKREVIIDADLLVLSNGIVAQENVALSKALKVPLNMEGFFMEAHIKLRPVEFASEGIYLCGLAHSPKNIAENFYQAKAASSKACIILSKEYIEASGQISVVDQELCAACLTCVRVCPFNAPFINEKGKAEIPPSKCRGCGICTAACPARAITLGGFNPNQIYSMCEVLHGG